MKKVLFVCVENSCRSQMAEGFARRLGEGALEAYSAGSSPSGKVHPVAINVMGEIGFDISAQKSKGFSELPVKTFDYVITLGCRDACPFFPAKDHVEWQISDPKNKGIDFFRKVRDEIRTEVEHFLHDIQGKDEGDGYAETFR